MVAGELTAVDAATAKWWGTELQKRVVDTCLRLHGGRGYMTEFTVSRAHTDGCAQTIYGGTTEVMQDIIGKNPGV
jgi:alkylation response protein AidB-like acyl-CoA dehydrogenase